MENKEKFIYIALLAAAIGDAMPTMADYFYFKRQQSLKIQLQSNKITPKQYWHKEAFAYYTYNSLYWIVIGGIVYAVKGSFALKLKVAAVLVATGAVFAILQKNIRQDEDFYSTHKLIPTK
jgi:hypothetical protein